MKDSQLSNYQHWTYKAENTYQNLIDNDKKNNISEILDNIFNNFWSSIEIEESEINQNNYAKNLIYKEFLDMLGFASYVLEDRFLTYKNYLDPLKVKECIDFIVNDPTISTEVLEEVYINCGNTAGSFPLVHDNNFFLLDILKHPNCNNSIWFRVLNDCFNLSFANLDIAPRLFEFIKFLDNDLKNLKIYQLDGIEEEFTKLFNKRKGLVKFVNLARNTTNSEILSNIINNEKKNNGSVFLALLNPNLSLDVMELIIEQEFASLLNLDDTHGTWNANFINCLILNPSLPVEYLEKIYSLLMKADRKLKDKEIVNVGVINRRTIKALIRNPKSSYFILDGILNYFNQTGEALISAFTALNVSYWIKRIVEHPNYNMNNMLEEFVKVNDLPLTGRV